MIFFLNVIILLPQPFIFYTTRNSLSPNVQLFFKKTWFTNLNVFEALAFYIFCHASSSSVMSLPIYICILPFLMTSFKEPFLLTFFSAGEILKSTIICMNITEILFWNFDEETVRRGLKYETDWIIFSRFLLHRTDLRKRKENTISPPTGWKHTIHRTKYRNSKRCDKIKSH